MKPNLATDLALWLGLRSQEWKHENHYATVTETKRDEDARRHYDALFASRSGEAREVPFDAPFDSVEEMDDFYRQAQDNG